MGVVEFYDKNYKKLLIIPVILILLAIGVISYNYYKTGELIQRDVSLSGGITITIPDSKGLTRHDAEVLLKEFDVDVRDLTKAGRAEGLVIDSSGEVAKAELIINKLSERIKISKNDYTVESIGASLGSSFFTETMKALIIAFLFMGAVVFLYFAEGIQNKIAVVILAGVAALFVLKPITPLNSLVLAVLIIGLSYFFYKKSMPSFAVILAALSDMIVVWAVLILIGVKLSASGIAAFLMLIGYSVDTDILLTSRVLKRKGQSILDATIGAMKTGMTMTFASLAAVSVAYFVTSSLIIKQIMLILIIGLLFDFIFTWIQNAGLLRMYLERKEREKNKVL